MKPPPNTASTLPHLPIFFYYFCIVAVNSFLLNGFITSSVHAILLCFFNYSSFCIMDKKNSLKNYTTYYDIDAFYANFIFKDLAR